MPDDQTSAHPVTQATIFGIPHVALTLAAVKHYQAVMRGDPDIEQRLQGVIRMLEVGRSVSAADQVAGDSLRTIPIHVHRLPHADGLPLPSYATTGAAGMDLLAAVGDPVTITPGGRALIPTGLTIGLPTGYELQIRSRSGLALKVGITVANAPGTIDEDYRGEIGVILHNTGRLPFTVERGDRIAQAVLAPVCRVHWQEVDALDETARNAGGFGSTGVA